MILPVEHFYTITHVKHKLLTQLLYAREFLRVAKEALQRFFPDQRTVSLARMRDCILQYIVSVIFGTQIIFNKEVFKISAEDQEKLWT